VALKEITMFRAVCDFCDALCPDDDEGIIAWTDGSSALEMAEAAMWVTQADGKLRCENCRWLPGGDFYEDTKTDMAR